MQTFISSGDSWVPSLPQVAARAEDLLNHQVDRRSRLPDMATVDTSAKERMRAGFAGLIEELIRSHFVCVPIACLKVKAYERGGSFDAPCPNRGLGVCNETTEKHLMDTRCV